MREGDSLLGEGEWLWALRFSLLKDALLGVGMPSLPESPGHDLDFIDEYQGLIVNISSILQRLILFLMQLFLSA